MKKEQIYLDLSKLTQKQIDWVMSTIPKGDSSYEIYGDCKCLIFWDGFQEWEVVHGDIIECASNRIEVNYTQFQIFCDKWGYNDPIPKPLTELERECLEIFEDIETTIKNGYFIFEKSEQLVTIKELITKLKSHENL